MLLTIDLPSPVARLRLSPWGTRLAVANDEGPGEVLVVDLPSGKPAARYSGLDECPLPAFRSEEELLIAHGDECRLCDITGNTYRVVELAADERGRGWLYGCGVSGDGKTFVAGGPGGVHVAALGGAAAPRLFPLPEEGAGRGGTLSPDGRLVAVVIVPRSEDRVLRLIAVLDARDGKKVRLLKLPWEQGYDYPCAFRPDNQVLAAGWRHKVLLFDLYPAKSPLGPEVVYSGEDWTLHAMGWAQPIACYALERDREVRAVWFSKEGIVLKVLSERGDAVVMAADEDRVLQSTAPPFDEPNKLWGATISPSGRAAARLDDRTVLIWDVPGWAEA